MTAEEVLALLSAEPSTTALLTDFDGTIAAISPDPSVVEPLPGAAAALMGLAHSLGSVAVVSGRPASFLASRFPTGGRLRLFGLYGLEEVTPDGSIAKTVELSVNTQVLVALTDAVLSAVPSAAVENKGSSVVLHWRARPEDEEVLRTVAGALGTKFGLALKEAKMSIELHPEGAPEKGSVVRRVASGRSPVAYAGDDLGDLDAFDALDELKVGGTETVRIAVASAEAPLALLNRADLVCAEPRELVALLESLAGRVPRDDSSS